MLSKHIKVKYLKEKLKNIPDNTEVSFMFRSDIKDTVVHRFMYDDDIAYHPRDNEIIFMTENFFKEKKNES